MCSCQSQLIIGLKLEQIGKRKPEKIIQREKQMKIHKSLVGQQYQQRFNHQILFTYFQLYWSEKDIYINLVKFNKQYIPKLIQLTMKNLIDEHGKFNDTLLQFPNSSGNLAIFGTQSSGKSTILNHAFHTHFQTLNSKQDRKRCTRGVWFENVGKFNIIDTQGFDSVQRGNDQRIYERQIALFCLAIADVIIVNIWMNQIGRYQGGQIPILRAVINAANYLVQSQTKTLLFVIKDCSKDANHEILKQQLEQQFNKILEECPSKGGKSLKFNLQYFFMSHYIYRKSQFQSQAEKLSTMVKIRKSCLNSHQPQDRITYMKKLWDTIIANDGQIDLRIEQQALRYHAINRIRSEIIKDMRDQLKHNVIKNIVSYGRLYSNKVKRAFEQLKQKLPKHVDPVIIKTQFRQIEEQLQYIIQKYFDEVVITTEQERIITKIKYDLEKQKSSLRLEKRINEERKKALQNYKHFLEGHRQSSILLKNFTTKLSDQTIGFERQVSHLFNIFQSKLEKQINEELDQQVLKLKFEGKNITDKLRKLCNQFQYKQWEINKKELWEKTVHRTLTQKLGDMIFNLRFNRKSYFGLFIELQTQIITRYKSVQKKTQKFIQQLLVYFGQQQSMHQYKQLAKQKIQKCLENALNEEMRRFKISLMMLGVFMFFFSSNLIWFLKLLKFRKRVRRYISILLTSLSLIIVVGSMVKNIKQTLKRR